MMGKQTLFSTEYFKVVKLTGQNEKGVTFIERNDAVLCVVTDSENVLCLKHYRAIFDKVSIELIGGIKEVGENFETAAAREVYEETGVEVNSSKLLGVFETSNGTTNERIYMVHAKAKLSQLKIKQYEPGITPVIFSLDEFKKKIFDGTITCMSSQLLAHKFFELSK